MKSTRNTTGYTRYFGLGCNKHKFHINLVTYEILPAVSNYQNCELVVYNTVYLEIDANILKEPTNFKFNHCFTLQIKAAVQSGTSVHTYRLYTPY
jgi:hypothetical protein